MGERLTPEQIALESIRGEWSDLPCAYRIECLNAHDGHYCARCALRIALRIALATLRTVEQERDAWHRRWLDETATSEQFERERDDARAALRLMQEANKS